MSTINNDDFITMEYVYVDKVLIDGKSEVALFTETQQNCESVKTSLGYEEDIVKWMMNDWSFREIILRNLFPKAKSIDYFFGVKKPITKTGTKPGDIDLLLVNNNDNISIGVECKIVKAESFKDKPPKINKIDSLKKGGVAQVNKYIELGFEETYILIIILDDGRYYKNPNILFRSTPYESLKALFEDPWVDDLNGNIGIAYAVISQINGNDINQTRGMGFRIERKAVPQEQTDDLTSKIKKLISSNDG